MKVIVLEFDESQEMEFMKIKEYIKKHYSVKIEDYKNSSSKIINIQKENSKLIIDYEKKLIIKNDQYITLNRLEFETLYYLALNRGLVISKEQIYETVWNDESDSDIHSVICVIYQIRKKIGKEYIKTHIGSGYQIP